MDFAETVAVLVAGELPGGMTDCSMAVAPFGQTSINIVFISVDNCTKSDRGPDQGGDCDLFDVLEHPDHDRTGALNHSENGRLFLGQRPTPPLPLQSPPSGRPSFFFTASGCPLCPATT